MVHSVALRCAARPCLARPCHAMHRLDTRCVANPRFIYTFSQSTAMPRPALSGVAALSSLLHRYAKNSFIHSPRRRTAQLRAADCCYADPCAPQLMLGYAKNRNVKQERRKAKSTFVNIFSQILSERCLAMLSGLPRCRVLRTKAKIFCPFLTKRSVENWRNARTALCCKSKLRNVLRCLARLTKPKISFISFSAQLSAPLFSYAVTCLANLSRAKP